MAVDAVDTYTLICENWVEAIQAGQDYHFELPVSERCDVSAGDVVGWGHEGQGRKLYFLAFTYLRKNFFLENSV